jgi:hypothetical protein
MCVSFMDVLEELDVGDPFLVIGNDVIVFDTDEVLSVTKLILGRLVVGCAKVRQCCPGGDALSW